MSKLHPNDGFLQSFAEGILDDNEAVAVAIHIDDCARCRSHVAALDPLTAAFLSVDDPEVPAALMADLRRAPPPLAHKSSSPEPAIAALLMGSSLAVMLLLGRPQDLLGTSLEARTALAALFGGLWTAAGQAPVFVWFLAASSLMVVAAGTARQRLVERSA
jgi:anti-sigma factor RsiW